MNVPRELNFSYGDTHFRAIFVDNVRGCAASEESCCICGEQLNNLAFYTTDPLLFYVHVACSTNPPQILPNILNTNLLPSSGVTDRGLFSNLFGSSNSNTHLYSGYSQYAPNHVHHAYNFPDHYYYGNNGNWGQTNSSSGLTMNMLGKLASSVLGAFLQVLFTALIL